MSGRTKIVVTEDTPLVTDHDEDGQPSGAQLTVQFVSRLMTGYETMGEKLLAQTEAMQEELRHSREQYARLAKQQLDLAREQEKAISESHKRMLDERESEQRLRLLTETAGEAKALIPIIGRRLMGITPGVKDSRGGLKGLAESLTEEQWATIIQTLSPGQLAALHDAFEADDPEQEEKVQ